MTRVYPTVSVIYISRFFIFLLYFIYNFRLHYYPGKLFKKIYPRDIRAAPFIFSLKYSLISRYRDYAVARFYRRIYFRLLKYREKILFFRSYPLEILFYY